MLVSKSKAVGGRGQAEPVDKPITPCLTTAFDRVQSTGQIVASRPFANGCVHWQFAWRQPPHAIGEHFEQEAIGVHIFLSRAPLQRCFNWLEIAASWRDGCVGDCCDTADDMVGKKSMVKRDYGICWIGYFICDQIVWLLHSSLAKTPLG